MHATDGALMYELPGNDTGRFSVAFNPATRPVKSWKEEVYEAAARIAGTADRPIFLAFSGGIDSEIMCNAFFDQGWGFQVLTVEHSDGGNRHDVQYAREWCRERGLVQEIVRFDVKEFFRTDIPRYAEEGYVSHNAFRYFQMRILELVAERGGYAVLGGGEQHYNVPAGKEPTPEDVHLNFDIGSVCPLEWSRVRGTSHEPYFFFSTPELCLSYLELPLVNYALTQYPAIFRNFSNRHFFTRLNYQTIWPDLVPRHKFSGFEAVSDVRAEVQKEMQARFGRRLQMFRLPIAEFRSQLKGS